jgi:hypothetical protein
MKPKSYAYVGPGAILRLLERPAERWRLASPADVAAWLNTLDERTKRGAINLTFVVDCALTLWIADQRSEHVVCARGERVLAAGELSVEFKPALRVSAASNQSTGYCPEPDSWDALASALDRAGLPRPGGYTASYLFRRCERCASINLIKDAVFECAVCEAPLSAEWNLAE